MAENNQKAENAQALVEKLSAIGWCVFFIWIGLAFFTNVGWGVGVLGLVVIALVGEIARKCFGLPLDWFWLMTGIIFVCGALAKCWCNLVAVWCQSCASW